MNKPKSWNTCSDCSDIFYPHADKEAGTGITVSMGVCPDCGKQNVCLIPIRDFEDHGNDFD